MKVSARNVLPGRVVACTPGSVNAEVEVELSGGERLVAVVTRASVDALGLAPGREVVALVKAPWVMVLTDAGAAKLSARNCLAGTVRTVTPGTVNAEVDIELAGGTVVSAVITKEAANELGLKPGVAARAAIKASHIVLGVPA